MGEDKSASVPLLPMAIRQGISQAVSPSQRRLLSSRLLLLLVAAALLYCLAVIANSSMSAPDYSYSSVSENVQTVYAKIDIETVGQDEPASSGSQESSPSTPPTPPTTTIRTTTTEAPFNPATTMKSETGPHHEMFHQPPKSVIVMYPGGDVQLDCKLKPLTGQYEGRQAITSWYKDGETFLTMGNRVYVDDDRFSVHIDKANSSLSLRIRDVTMKDAGDYTCQMPLRWKRDDEVTVVLDIIPREDDDSPPPPQRVRTSLNDIFIPGFNVSPDVCPNEGKDIDVVIALASHPLYVSSRDRIRNTWASLLNKKQVKVFGVGELSTEIGDNVKEEAKKNNDMVFGKFRDLSIEPYTESVKRLALLSWMLEHCRFAKFMLMATHNEFVNAQLLQTLVKDLDPDVPAVYGLTDNNQTVVRDPNHPLYMSYLAYQSREVPQYARQPVFLLSRAAIGPLVQAALHINAVPHYDLVLTGLAAEQANITRVSMPNLYKAGQNIQKCEYQEVVAGPSWGEPLDLKVSGLIKAGKNCTK